MFQKTDVHLVAIPYSSGLVFLPMKTLGSFGATVTHRVAIPYSSGLVFLLVMPLSRVGGLQTSRSNPLLIGSSISTLC